MKKQKESQPGELIALKDELAKAQIMAQTYRQQRDNTTSQLQDLDAKCGVEIRSLQTQLKAAQDRLAALEKKPTA